MSAGLVFILLLGAILWTTWRPSPAEDAHLTADHSRGGVAIPTAVPARPVYPYSVVPGGVHTPDELARAVALDPDVVALCGGVDLDAVRHDVLREPMTAHVAYRLEDGVYWTRHAVRLQAGEPILTDGQTIILSRCGNCVSVVPLGPVSAAEPDPTAFSWLGTPTVSALGPPVRTPDGFATGGSFVPPGSVGRLGARPGVDDAGGGPAGFGGRRLPGGGFIVPGIPGSSDGGAGSGEGRGDGSRGGGGRDPGEGPGENPGSGRGGRGPGTGPVDGPGPGGGGRGPGTGPVDGPGPGGGGRGPGTGPVDGPGPGGGGRGPGTGPGEGPGPGGGSGGGGFGGFGGGGGGFGGFGGGSGGGGRGPGGGGRGFEFDPFEPETDAPLPVPEPGTLVLVGSGVAVGIARYVRKRRADRARRP